MSGKVSGRVLATVLVTALLAVGLSSPRHRPRHSPPVTEPCSGLSRNLPNSRAHGAIDAPRLPSCSCASPFRVIQSARYDRLRTRHGRVSNNLEGVQVWHSRSCRRPRPGKSPRFAATSSRSGDAPEPQPGGLSEPRLCAIQFRPIALPVDGLRSECACDSEFREKPVVVVYFDR